MAIYGDFLMATDSRPPDSDFEDHTGLEGESGSGLDRIRMALRSVSVNRDNLPLLKAVSG